MKKRVIYIFGVLTITALVLVTAYSQEDMMFVDNSVFLNPERVPAAFAHEDHNEAAGIDECNECHHVYEEGIRLEDESSEDQMCSECHDSRASGRIPGLMKAFHLNCKGCHLAEKKGPIMCGECHQKR